MEKQRLISVRGIYRESKVLFKKHIYYFVTAFLFIGVVNVGINALSPDVEKFSSLPLMIIGGLIAVSIAIIAVLIQIYLQIKVIRATLRTMREPEYVPQFNNFFVQEGNGRFLVKRFFLTGLLVGLFALGGIILLILPGIYIAVRMSFATYVVADTGAKPMDAIRESWAMTKGKFWALARYSVIVVFFAILTFIAFIVTAPLLQVMTLNLYERLLKDKQTLASTPVLEA
jgi:uncharacterized membrane protein